MVEQNIALPGGARVLWVSCALIIACGGNVDVREADQGATDGVGASGGFGGSSGGGGSLGGAGGSGAELPAPTTRAARLTHTQWDNSVRDLFRLDAEMTFASLLRSDPVQAGAIFDNAATSLSVDEALVSGYRSAAADVAAFVTSDAAHLAKVAPEAADASARQADFIDMIGLRGHRRPLTVEERDEYSTLFAMGPSLYSGLGAFEAGARAVIEALLQSPEFLYRVEASGEETNGVIALTSYEIASRLSYTLWNTMPDDALFAAAASDALQDRGEVSVHAKRLLADARARDVVESFHDQLFETERFSSISPAPAFFPDAPATLGEDAETELGLFVRDVFTEGGGYRELLTSTDTFVNADLAAIYGLSGNYGDAFQKAALDGTQRRGIFTQVGFLARNATSAHPDPIHRGVFLARRIACMTIAAPPANVPPLPMLDASRTNRQLIEDHTQQPGTICASCHTTMINPLGFPFEHYDAIGQYRTADNGQAIDSSTEPTIGTMKSMVDDALQLAAALAQSPDVHRCYARHWLEFAYGRAEADQDEALLARVSAGSLQGELSVQGLIEALVTSDAFLSRSTEELP